MFSKNTFKKIMALLSTSLGVWFVGLILINPFGAPMWGYLLALLTTGICGLSIHSLLQDTKNEKQIKELAQMQKLLSLISQNAGRATLAEIVMKMNMPLPELKAKLDELQKEGVLGLEVSNTGEVLYTASETSNLIGTWDTHKLMS